MIYLDDSNTLCSIIEGIYLSEKFSDRFKNSNILICPNNTKYVTGKTIIINHNNYPKNKIEELYFNGCTIISRVKLDYDLDYVKFCPYIVFPEMNIMWNGLTIDVSDLDSISEIEKKLEDSIIFDITENNLCFPKLTGIEKNLILDTDGNITCLGWLLHQVGINIDKNSVFKDLDLIKTKKMLL